WYHAWIEDELLSLQDAAGNPLGTVNADRTVHQGIELGLSWRVRENWVLRQSYLWNDFRFDDDAVYGDNRIAGVPEHFYRAELIYEWPRGYYLGPNVEWVPEDFPVDHANTLYASGYATVGLKGGYRSDG